jgi:aminopeptidase N
MKKFLLSLFVLFTAIAGAQREHLCAKSKRTALAVQFSQIQAKSLVNPPSPYISHEMKYDVKFVHLDLNVERTSKRVTGTAKTVATVTAAVLDTFMTILYKNDTINSISINGNTITPIRTDSMVKIGLSTPLLNGVSFTVIVDYRGTAPNGGSAIGSGFSSQGSWYGGGNRATWSLSESFVAYHWWPCKQVLTDKIDSSWVFITTDSTNKAGSNGVLTNVVNIGNKKRYEWKSHKPIDYYLISVAVSKFKEYNLYAKPQYLPNDSILIQNYIDAAAYTNSGWIANDKVELDKMPQTMEFLCDIYGMYPFYKEKYGHCMVPLGGGMEHNTMTTIGFFDLYVDAHELGHQWWGDQVTCKSWGDIWMNEGFAAYTEILTAEYLDPANFVGNVNTVHQSVMSFPGGSIFFTNSDTMNSNRIFDSRLTYDKGGAILHSLRFLTNNDSLWFNTLRGFQNTYKNKTAGAVEFQNYYQTATGINPTQFFSQWYYGQGYPTFTVRYNYTGTQCIISCTQAVSCASATPIFITPLEYKIIRTGHPDTTIRVMHSNTIETYTISLTGTVTSMVCEPNNWLINKVVGPTYTSTLGVSNPVGIAESEKYNQLSIGPNPTNGVFSLNNPSRLQGSVKIFDLNGKLILQKPLEEKSSFDLTNYPVGVYVVKTFDVKNEERSSQKVIKQ